MTTATLYNRAGAAFSVALPLPAKPTRAVRHKCGRCGGAGRSDKWARTGYTCYQCNGAGLGDTKFEPLYTAEKLAKLVAAQAKRDATREAKRLAVQAEEAARRERERADVIAAHKPLLDRIAAARKDDGEGFLAELAAQVRERAKPLSDAQVEAAHRALDRIEAEQARIAKADWVGHVGERVELVLSYVRGLDFTGDEWGAPERWLTIARDAQKNTVTYWGPYNGLRFPTEFRTEDGSRIREGAQVTLRATIKKHGANKRTGEPETTITRPTFAKERKAA